jgi:glycerate dehydrogenase
VTPARIVFLDAGTLWPDTRLRTPRFPHDLSIFEQTRPDEVEARIGAADIVITNKVRITAEALAKSPRVRLVAVAATGYDAVDVAACRERGVVVSNIRGYAATSVPEHVFGLILALRRNLVAYREAVIGGRWERAGQFCFLDFPIRDLAGSTLGVVGGGTLGAEVARLGRAFGMQVMFAGRKGGALTPETMGLIAAPEFAAMRRRPLMINTARGGLVDEEALADALDRGMIAGAGFDVASREPPGADHPLMALAARPNVILTPHVAWASREAVQSLADQLIDNIEAFVAGTPRNRVA